MTRGPHKERQNLGIYRQQVLGKNKVIMRWLSHRGGALDYQEWCRAHPGERFPVAVALGPILPPSSVRSRRCRIPCLNMPLPGRCAAIKPKWSSAFQRSEVPASAEIVLEGYIEPGEMAPEGPYGDHTGYYNEIDQFPVFTVTHITQRRNAIYHSTYTGRPPDEPAIPAWR